MLVMFRQLNKSAIW